MIFFAKKITEQYKTLDALRHTCRDSHPFNTHFPFENQASSQKNRKIRPYYRIDPNWSDFSDAQTKIFQHYNNPLFAYCFDPSSIYLGIGAALFRLEQHLSGLGGLARINGAVSDSPNTFASLNHSQWVWGGIAQIGWVHSFTSSWFLDLNYS